MPLTAILAILSSTKKRYWCGAPGRPFRCLDVWNMLFVGQGFGFWFEWCLNWSSLITAAIHITSFPFYNQWHFSLRNVITVHGAKGSKWHEMALREAIIHKIKVFFCEISYELTRPLRLPTPLCHTYSECSGRALSHGTTQYMTYLFKKLTATRFREPSKQWFWGSEVQIT